ncbi:hypothetical protein SAMN04487861_10523 [Selenomonas ruminantium]|uniref:YolD-like protein n=1 Tax=Selenomonas ruminantium TaxID=971 RepID=A0A1I3D0Q3_SELRU|nr:hypothetical protein [Selenomonas ruminantium]SFH80206.1 hypothetical protein SAMN04487861_10523 [Selenomonas ruminantium]
MKEEQPNKYGDIINLPRPASKRHPSMPLAKRAAQFSPFAALTGYEDAVRESARITLPPPNLADDEQELLDRSLQQVMAAPSPKAAITYFVADAYKDGGRYETRTAVIKRLDHAHQQLVLQDGTRIDLIHIVRIQPL